MTNLNQKSEQMAHVVNLISIAMLDGKITESERDLIYQIAGELGLNEDEFQQCVDVSQKAGAEGQVVYQVPGSDDEKVVYLKNLALMMMVDGEISESEKRYLSVVADKFGFDGDEAVEALIKVTYEEIQQHLNSQPSQDNEPSSDSQPPQEGKEPNQEEMQKEIQERTEAGKQAMLNHEIQKAFDLLYLPACVEPRATRLLLKITNEYRRMRLITMEQIKRNRVDEMAEKGYALPQYIMGRFHQQVKPEEDSIEKAKKYYEAAMKAGIGDAFASKAIMVLDGYYGMVDLDLYHALMHEGFEKGYCNAQCSHSLSMMLRDTVFGRYGITPDPQSVINAIKTSLDGNESDDIDVVDPLYYKILGEAYSELGDNKTAGEYCVKAVDMGYYECIYDYTCLSLPTEEFTHKAWELWKKMNDEGCYRKDPMSLVLSTLYFETDYADLSPEEQQKRRDYIKEHLLMADSLGEEFAGYLLGLNYYEGNYGFEQDLDLAWKCFNRAAYMEDGNSYAMLAQMIENGQSPEGYDQTYAEHFHLQALRRGVKEELEQVVKTYLEGGLTEFAKEIETIYIPRYELQQKEAPREDPYEGLDLKLIAIVKTDGTADIIEFDVENWDEMPAFVDADRLDAIRVQPLYDISKELGFDGHVTGWVDNMGLMRNLPENPIGCRIYPGSIVGDMILTLEDDSYHPESFTDIESLKKVIAALGAQLDGIFIDDGPDDDGRYDPWS